MLSQTSTLPVFARVIADSGENRKPTTRFGNLDDPKTRRRIYGWVAVALYFVGLGMLVLRVRYGHSDRKWDFANSDGKYYYAYVAAVFVDGTLDSEIAKRQWGYGVSPKELTPLGHVINIYPIGVSLTVVPSFLLAHVTSMAIHGSTHSALFKPDGYSCLYQLFNFGWLVYLSWATFVMLDSLMSRYFKLNGMAITLGILGAWIGTQYVYHELRFPLMSVITAPFWTTALIYLAAQAVDDVEASRIVGWRWAGMVFCFAMAFVCRNTNAILLPFCIYPAYRVIRAGMLPTLLAKAPLLLLGCIPVALQMCVWNYQFGHFVVKSYGSDARFYWTHPAFWQIMFSLRAGMFVWVPVWTLGTIGAILYLRGNRGSWIVACYLISFLIIWYVNSSYWAWPFSNYPNRGFLEMIGLPAIGLGLLIQATERGLFQRRLVLGLLVAGTLVTIALGFAYDARRVIRYGDTVNDMGPIGARWAR